FRPGGYMLACVADPVVAAPFAIIGSIGVVAQVPNLHRLLKKHDVDFQEMTAGEFKRTVSVNSPAVISWKSTSCFLSRRWRFGTCATTPIDPMIAKGAATTGSATQASM